MPLAELRVRAEEISSQPIRSPTPKAIKEARVELHRGLARARDVRGYARDSAGNADDAIDDYARAALIAERLWSDDRLNAIAMRLMMWTYDNRADVLCGLGRCDEAEATYRLALEKAAASLAADPLRSDRVCGVTRAHEKLADARREGGTFGEADDRSARALTIAAICSTPMGTAVL